MKTTKCAKQHRENLAFFKTCNFLAVETANFREENCLFVQLFGNRDQRASKKSTMETYLRTRSSSICIKIRNEATTDSHCSKMEMNVKNIRKCIGVRRCILLIAIQLDMFGRPFLIKKITIWTIKVCNM